MSGNVEQRLAVLLDLADRYGTADLPSLAVLIDLPPSEDDIVGLAPTSRRIIGPALMRLLRNCVLVTGRRAVLIKTPAGSARWSPDWKQRGLTLHGHLSR